MFKCEFCGLEFSNEKDLNNHIRKEHKTENFIKKAREVHGDKYDYTKVEYINNHTKVCIICSEHGKFWQTPGNHISNKRDCPICGKLIKSNKLRKTTEDFIKRAKLVHNDKYDYSKVVYTRRKDKVTIICPTHGEFQQTPGNHLKGAGCPFCYGNASLCNDDFIEKAREIHGDKYDYSLINYVNSTTEIEIICPEHGIFKQVPHVHLKPCGCPKCAKCYRYTSNEWIQKAKQIHGNKYDYSNVDYVNSQTKVCIVCPIHGEFNQTPSHHLNGCGCPICKTSKLETEVLSVLPNLQYQKRFEWLKNKFQMTLDFYDENNLIGIECQGEQHFHISNTSYFGRRMNKLPQVLFRDNLKYNLCKEHGIEIVYYFPKEFLKYGIDFYKDKKCFHNTESLKEYLFSLES